MVCSVKEECDEVLSAYSGLHLTILPDGVCVLEGAIRLDAERAGRHYLVRDFPLRIRVEPDFPDSIPKVWVTDESVLEGYEHRFTDGSLCLGARGELALFLQDRKNLLSFFEEIIVGNLYAIEYYRIYAEMPSEDRRHGAEGILEAYRELFEVDDYDAALRLLSVACGASSYRGHLPCPCGSGLRTRNCHGGILMKILKGSSASAVKEDFKDVYSEWCNCQKLLRQREMSMSVLRSQVSSPAKMRLS